MKKTLIATVATVVAAWAAVPAHAASVYVTPAASSVPLANGTVSFELMMNFSSAEATVGGGIDIDVEGPISFFSFTPSAYFLSAGDPAFSGYGTLHADKDFEVHIGSFGGLSSATPQSLGTITVNLNAAGPGTVSLAANTFWGGFYSAVNGNAMAVTMSPASLTVTAVPEPTPAALLLLGAAGLALRLHGQRRGRAA